MRYKPGTPDTARAQALDHYCLVPSHQGPTIALAVVVDTWGLKSFLNFARVMEGPITNAFIVRRTNYCDL